MRRHAIASLLLGLFLSGAGLWYALRGVDLAAMVQSMGRVGALWVLGSVAAALISLLLRAIRWRLLLNATERIELGALVSATFIGMAANNLLPARLGEAVRAWVLANRQRMPLPTVLASILVERLLDIIALLILFGLSLFAVPTLNGEAAIKLKNTGLVVLAAVAAGVAALFLTLRFRAVLRRLEASWAGRGGSAWRGRLVGLVHRFVEDLWVFRDVAQGLAVAGLSFVVWAASIASFQLLADGFDLGLSLPQTTLVFAIVLFGIAIPSAPGFIGTFHGFCVAGLTLVAGTDPTTALAYATVLHGSQWLAVNVAGLGCLLAERSVTWSGMTDLLGQTERGMNR